MRKILNCIKKAAPKLFKGLFMRITVIFCIGYIVRITEKSLNMCEVLKISPATIYTTAVGFFGAELVMLIVKKIYGNKTATATTDQTETKTGKKIENGKPLPLP